MDQQKIWDFFQNAPESYCAFGSPQRYVALARLIKSGDRVLNIGVGRGGMEEVLINNSCDTYTLDPSERSINALQKRWGDRVKAFVGYSQELPFENAFFDVVIMSEVMEHLSDDILVGTLSEVHRVLKSGGRFIGTVPADENLNESIVVCPKCGEVFHRWGHVQSFNKVRLKYTLESKFRISRLDRKYFGDVKKLNWKGKSAYVFKKLLIAIGLKGANESYLFVAIKS